MKKLILLKILKYSSFLLVFHASIDPLLAYASTAAEPNILLQVPLFGYTKATNIAEYIKNVYQAGLYIIVPFIIIVIIGSGILWIIAGGDKQLIGKAKERIKYSLIGLCIALFSYVLLSFVGITELKTTELEYINPEAFPDLDLNDTSASGLPPGVVGDITKSNPYAATCQKFKSNGISKSFGYDKAKRAADPAKAAMYDQFRAECMAYGSKPPPGMALASSSCCGQGTPAAVAALNNAINCIYTTHPDVISIMGGKIRGGGWRSATGQAGSVSGMKATPCCSNHGAGVAFDLSYGKLGGKPCPGGGCSGCASYFKFVDQYISPCMNQNGLKASLRGGQCEPWHFSPSGG